jgi:AcrR family transcriptional regulator
VDAPTARLVRGAREAFLRRGVAGASMTDIARAAGVVRQTAYKWVSTRDDLVELAIVQVCEELQALVDAFDHGAYDDLAERLTEFLANAVEVTGSDVELAGLVAALPDERVRSVLGGSHPVEVLIEQSLRPILEDADAAGRLRPGATVDLAARWLQGVLTWFLLGEHDAAALRRELRQFAVPSVLAER